MGEAPTSFAIGDGIGTQTLHPVGLAHVGQVTRRWNSRGLPSPGGSRARVRKDFNNLAGFIKLLLCALLCVGLAKRRN